VLFVGESGCGKSTCVSHWLKQFTSSHPQVAIIPHFVGCDSGSSDISNFMRRCTNELRHHYLDSDICDVIDIHDVSDFARVTEAFRAAISLGKTGRKNIALIPSFIAQIVFDTGLDSFKNYFAFKNWFLCYYSMLHFNNNNYCKLHTATIHSVREVIF